MKKFKLVWDERVLDSDGDFLHMEGKSQIIEANSEDEACDIWEAANKHNDCQNGLDSCTEVVEHPLFAKHLKVIMPDSFIYGVPVEFIARHRAEYYASKDYAGDVTKSLIEDTLPLFESDDYEIQDWAVNNLNWSDVKNSAVILGKSLCDNDMEDAWANGEHSIV